MVNKFENNEDISLSDFFGDVQNFEGFRQVKPGLWEVCLTN